MSSLKEYFKTKGGHNVNGVFVNHMRNQGMCSFLVRTEDEWSRVVAVDSNIDPCIRENNLLLKAIVKGDIKEVNILLEMGHDASWKDKDGKNALHHAMEQENVPLIKQLADLVPYKSIGTFRFDPAMMKPEFAFYMKQLFDNKMITADEGHNFRKLLAAKALMWGKNTKTMPATIKAFYKEFHKKNPEFANVIIGFVLKGEKSPGCRESDHMLYHQKDWDQWINQSDVDVLPKRVKAVVTGLKIQESSLLSFIDGEQWSEVYRLLDIGFDPEVVYEAEGTNALHWAIFKRNLFLMKRLVSEFKMDLSKPDKKGYPSFQYNFLPNKPYNEETVQWVLGLENAEAVLKANENIQDMALMMKKMKEQKQEKEFNDAKEKKAKETEEAKKRYTFDLKEILVSMKPIDILARVTDALLELEGNDQAEGAKKDKDAKELTDLLPNDQAKETQLKELKDLHDNHQACAEQNKQLKELKDLHDMNEGFKEAFANEKEKALKKEINVQIGVRTGQELAWFQLIKSILDSKTDDHELKKVKLVQSYQACLLFEPQLSLWIEKNPL